MLAPRAHACSHPELTHASTQELTASAPGWLGGEGGEGAREGARAWALGGGWVAVAPQVPPYASAYWPSLLAYAPAMRCPVLA
eukprot:966440-Rhodomonas_salina.3